MGKFTTAVRRADPAAALEAVRRLVRRRFPALRPSGRPASPPRRGKGTASRRTRGGVPFLERLRRRAGPARALLTGLRPRRVRAFVVPVLATALLVGLDGDRAPGQDMGAGMLPGDLTPGQVLRGRGVPPELSPADISRYRRIYAFQDEGLWKKAEREIKRLDNRLLLGHIRYHKLMHPTAYRSPFEELAEWLKEYGDHPGARRLYRLARARKPADAPPPPRPVDQAYLGGRGEDRPVDEDSTVGDTAAGRAFAREIIRLVRRNSPEKAAVRLNDGTSLLDGEDLAQLEGHVSAGFFSKGRFWTSYSVANDAARDAGKAHPWLHFRAGLAAWRTGLERQALEHFREGARKETGSGWETAAGAYWAARLHKRRGETEEVQKMLRTAADHPRTLYGQLALALLGEDDPFDWSPDPWSTVVGGSWIGDRPEVKRAIALIQVGRVHEADQEIRHLAGRVGKGHEALILGIAEALGLPSVQVRLGSRLAAVGDFRLHALYPAADWAGSAAFSVDRAFVHAVIRKESGFHERARSPRGARGLMQVMPATARLLSGDSSLRGANADRLYDPGFNLSLGQDLLVRLLDHPNIKGNLVYALIAYNAGMTRLIEWKKEIESDDPLFFIESIPSSESRWFVKRVLANLWMYRSRFGQDKPARADLAGDDWPRYKSLDEDLRLRDPANAGA